VGWRFFHDPRAPFCSIAPGTLPCQFFPFTFLAFSVGTFSALTEYFVPPCKFSYMAAPLFPLKPAPSPISFFVSGGSR